MAEPTRHELADRVPERALTCRCDVVGERLRRLAHGGPALCEPCYQRAWKEREVRTAPANLHATLAGFGLAPMTVSNYVRTIQTTERWFRAHGWRLAGATPSQVASYAETVPLTFASRSMLRAALRAYWELASHPRPPLRAIRVPPKPTMVCRALDEDDARILAKAARARGDLPGLAVLLGLYQGMRREEIATTRWDAIDAGWITVIGKGAKTRRIPVHPMVAGALASTPVLGPYVFPGQWGGPVNVMTVWTWVRQVAEEAGVAGVRPHVLRHTCLATQNDATGDLRTTQFFAGHSKPETTSGYTRTTNRRLEEAMRALDYEGG